MIASNDELRARFTALRLTEEAECPALDLNLPSPNGQHRRPRVTTAAFALVAALVMLAVGLRWNTPKRAVEEHIPNTPSLLAWKSPTEFLLTQAVTSTRAVSSPSRK